MQYAVAQIEHLQGELDRARELAAVIEPAHNQGLRTAILVAVLRLWSQAGSAMELAMMVAQLFASPQQNQIFAWLVTFVLGREPSLGDEFDNLRLPANQLRLNYMAICARNAAAMQPFSSEFITILRSQSVTNYVMNLALGHKSHFPITAAQQDQLRAGQLVFNDENHLTTYITIFLTAGVPYWVGCYIVLVAASFFPPHLLEGYMTILQCMATYVMEELTGNCDIVTAQEVPLYAQVQEVLPLIDGMPADAHDVWLPFIQYALGKIAARPEGERDRFLKTVDRVKALTKVGVFLHTHSLSPLHAWFLTRPRQTQLFDRTIRTLGVCVQVAMVKHCAA
jgi:hypothetical protein